MRLKTALDGARSGTGRPLRDERRLVEGVIWRQRNGAKWRAVPPEYGPWWKVAQLHIRWSRAGVWERAFARLRDAGRPELGEVFLDGTSIRAHQKAAGAKGAAVHALGRSRGGYGTKACTVCDAQGRALGFALIPGQASELRAAPSLLLLVVLLGVVARVICDGAYSSATWRALVRQVGAEPVVRPNPTHRSAPEHDRDAYRRRSRVENLWARLKEWRALATRYDKTVQSFSGALHLAAALDWLSNGP